MFAIEEIVLTIIELLAKKNQVLMNSKSKKRGKNLNLEKLISR